MKRIISLILTVFTFCMITSCNKKENKNDVFSREDVAVKIADSFGMTGGDYLPYDYTEDEKESSKIKAVLSRGILGPCGIDYEFKKDAGVKRKELAKVALQTYAALKGVEVHNLRPGLPITKIGEEDSLDIAELNYQEKWYVYASNTYGFVRFDEDKNFRPDEFVTEEDVDEMISNINLRSQVKSQSFEEYKQNLEENFRIYTPENQKVSDNIDVVKIQHSFSRGERLATFTMQGLANKGKAKVFAIKADADPTLNMEWMVDYAIEKGYAKTKSAHITDVDTFIKKYKSCADGVVVYPEDNYLTVNLAVDYAAVTNSIVVSDKMIDRVKEWGFSDDEIFEIESLNLSSFVDYTQYAYDNLFQFMRRDALMYVFGGDNEEGRHMYENDYERDFSVQQKIPSIWVPNINCSYAKTEETSVQDVVAQILENFPANIPVLGFQHCQVGSLQLGLGEQRGNSFCGAYGKYSTVNTSTPSMSFNTCIPVEKEEKIFKPVEVDIPQYDPNKKYVSLVMTESSDSPFYIGSLFKSRQWDDVEARKEVPFSYALGLSNYDLYPLVLQYWNDTKQVGDYFFGGISGLGYCYPFIDFGENGVLDETGRMYVGRDEIIADHYMKTNYMLKKLGYTQMCLYDYADSFWSKSDYRFTQEKILPHLETVDTVVAGMARGISVDLTGREVSKKLDDGTVLFHNCTPFSVLNGDPFDTTLDDKATDYLVENIFVNTSGDGHFYSCMAWSWSYGPRRLKLVLDKFKVEHPEYEFVRQDVLTKMYNSVNQ